MKPNLPYPKAQKHNLFTDASHSTYSGALTQAVDGPDDFRPIAYISDSFSNMQQRWPASKN